MAAYRFALLACCALVLAPAAARADVLEIGAGGATWVSGGPVAAEPAPAALAEDAEFVAMHKAVDASVVALRSALRRQDGEAARRSLEGLKQPYSRMFLKFG